MSQTPSLSVEQGLAMQDYSQRHNGTQGAINLVPRLFPHMTTK